MIKASLAREITNTVLSLNADQFLLKIMRDIAERMVDDKGKSYIYAEISSTDELIINRVNTKLIELGYNVDVSLCKEDGYTDFTVRW